MLSKLPLFTLNLFLIIGALSTTITSVQAEQTIKYRGEARRDNQIVYIEDHLLRVDPAGKLISAETIYRAPTGSVIATLKSDFVSSLTTPNHTLHNFVTNNIQGIRRDENEIVMFSKNENEAERERIIRSDLDSKTLMGCQGLNYYLLENLDKLLKDEQFPLRFLMPGKLDYYDFMVRYVGEPSTGPGERLDVNSNEKIARFEITIDSWFLGLFAPKLLVDYDRVNKRIVRYEGLSNITDENGKPQTVTIDYTY